MGKPFYQYFEGENIYACKQCHIHLSTYSELISKVLIFSGFVLFNKKAFQGRGGKAFLFNIAYFELFLVDFMIFNKKN